jgi:tetratricopeptide (TPR) repeat protein
MSTKQPVVSLLGKIAGYTEILAKDPRSTIFVPLCEAYRQMGLLDDALDIALKGVRTLPSFSPGYTVLGRIQAQRGAYEEAIAAFEKVLETDDESLAALRGLARIRLRKGEIEQAGKLLQRVIVLKPDDAAAQKMLAALGKSSSPATAPAFKSPSNNTATAPSPTDSSKIAAEPISTPTIAEIYIKQGFPKRAMKVYRDLLNADPHNDLIRQKLIDLKKQIDDEALSKPQAPPLMGPNSVDLSEKPAVGASESAGSNGYAEALNNWLDSIRGRREHVQ